MEESSLSELSTSSDEEYLRRHTQLARSGTEWLNSIHKSSSNSAEDKNVDQAAFEKVCSSWECAVCLLYHPENDCLPSRKYVYSFLTRISELKSDSSLPLTFERFVHALIDSSPAVVPPEEGQQPKKPEANELVISIVRHFQRLLGADKQDWFATLQNYVSNVIKDPYAYFNWRTNKLRNNQDALHKADEDSSLFWELSFVDKLHLLRSMADACLSDSERVRQTIDDHYNYGKQRVVKRSPLENELVIEPLGRIGNVEVWAIDDSYHLFTLSIPPPQASSSAYIAKTKWSLLATDQESYEAVVRSLDKQTAELESKLETLRAKYEQDLVQLKASQEYESLSNQSKKARENALEKPFKQAEKAIQVLLAKLQKPSAKSKSKKAKDAAVKPSKKDAKQARKEERLESERALKKVLVQRLEQDIPAYYKSLEKQAEKKRKAAEREAYRIARAARFRNALSASYAAHSDSEDGGSAGGSGSRPTRGARLRAEHALSNWGAKQNAYDRKVEQASVIVRSGASVENGHATGTRKSKKASTAASDDVSYIDSNGIGDGGSLTNPMTTSDDEEVAPVNPREERARKRRFMSGKDDDDNDDQDEGEENDSSSPRSERPAKKQKVWIEAAGQLGSDDDDDEVSSLSSVGDEEPQGPSITIQG